MIAARGVTRLLALLAALLMLPVVPASAHTRSESHSSWTVDGTTVHATFTLPDLEAARLTPDRSPPTDALLIAYATHMLSVQAGKAICPLAIPVRMVGAAAGYRRMELHFRCPDGTVPSAVIDNALFDLVPTHVNFAQIQTADGRFVEQLFTSDARSLSLVADNGQGLENASFFRYVSMGILHIFTGIDHQLFLLALVLLSRNLRDVAFVITGFTLGHSVTLALAVTGIFRPHAEFIDALVGLTIALVATDNIMANVRRPALIAGVCAALLAAMALASLAGLGGLPPLLLLGAAIFGGCYLTMSGHVHNAAPLRLVVTTVFGLIHGFGFAAELVEMKLPTARLAELLVGFNLGVEIGQLTLVVLAIGIVALLVRWKIALPRPLVVDFGAALLVGMGLFWFVSRSYA